MENIMQKDQWPILGDCNSGNYDSYYIMWTSWTAKLVTNQPLASRRTGNCESLSVYDCTHVQAVLVFVLANLIICIAQFRIKDLILVHHADNSEIIHIKWSTWKWIHILQVGFKTKGWLGCIRLQAPYLHFRSQNRSMQWTDNQWFKLEILYCTYILQMAKIDN